MVPERSQSRYRITNAAVLGKPVVVTMTPDRSPRQSRSYLLKVLKIIGTCYEPINISRNKSHYSITSEKWYHLISTATCREQYYQGAISPVVLTSTLIPEASHPKSTH